MTIRKAVIHDVPAIIEMWASDEFGSINEVISSTISPNYLEAFQKINSDENQFLVVMEDDYQIVGSLQLTLIQYLFKHGGVVALIEEVIVKEGFRNKGIGEKLIRWAMAKSKERGACLIQLTSNKKRTSALGFYNKLGFTASHEGFKMKLN